MVTKHVFIADGAILVMQKKTKVNDISLAWMDVVHSACHLWSCVVRLHSTLSLFLTNLPREML